MSRSRLRLRDVALGYASRGIPVLPLHYPSPTTATSSRSLVTPSPQQGRAARVGIPAAASPPSTPSVRWSPHGVKDATCNRARILAWWTRHPQANIGLATGHTFDVLDIDGPEGAQAIRELAATHGLQSCGPLVRTGGAAGTTARVSKEDAPEGALVLV